MNGSSETNVPSDGYSATSFGEPAGCVRLKSSSVVSSIATADA